MIYFKMFAANKKGFAGNMLLPTYIENDEAVISVKYTCLGLSLKFSGACLRLLHKRIPRFTGITAVWGWGF